MPYLWAEGELFGDINDKFELLPEIKAISEGEDYVMSVQNGDLSIKEWFRDFKDADVHFLYNKNDKRPFSVYVYLLKRIIKRTLHME